LTSVNRVAIFDPDMNRYMSDESLNLIIASAIFIVLLIIGYFLYRSLFSYFKKKVSRTTGLLDDFILNLFKIPTLWVFYSILIKIFTRIFIYDLPFSQYVSHINTLLFIFSLTWVAIQVVNGGAYFLQKKLDIGAESTVYARKNLTQIKVFKAIVNSVIIIIAIAASLMTFEKARNIGVSLLTSAGIIGIIVGFAAQKSLGLILAGIQIAITQPIRLDDVVIVEGEYGNVEEITLTYVVIRTWDERRVILPVTYFLEKPFQNWTRTGSDIIGSVLLTVDSAFPVENIRKVLPKMLEGNTDWDGRVINVQVTNSTDKNKEIRIQLSSSNASKNWDLRSVIREKMIDYIINEIDENPEP